MSRVCLLITISLGNPTEEYAKLYLEMACLQPARSAVYKCHHENKV